MRSLVPRNAFQELATWHRDIDDLFRRFFSSEREETNILPLAGWFPTMEAFERDGRYIVRADLPGVDPKDVEVSVTDDALVIKVERKAAEEVKEKDYHYRETSYGRFERSLALPKGTDKDKVAAKYENGVLEISMPLPESAARKKVQIDVGGSQPKQIKAA